MAKSADQFGHAVHVKFRSSCLSFLKKLSHSMVDEHMAASSLIILFNILYSGSSPYM